MLTGLLKGLLIWYRVLNSSPVVHKMAYCTFSRFSSETSGAIPLWLVADIPEHPSHASADSA